MSSTDYSVLWVYTEDASLQFISRVYDGTINITGGGGFESVARPLKQPVTPWRGPQSAYTMEIPLVLDTLDDPNGRDVEDRCRALEKMAGALVTDSEGQPPLLVLNANGGIPNDVYNFPPLRWVIPEPPTYGEQLRNGSGRRVRQVVTVKFMNYVAYDQLTRDKNVQTTRPANTTVVKHGETFNAIAARTLKQYGGAHLGNRLAHYNGARDGASKPPPGTTVRIPNKAQVKQWLSSPRR